MTTYLDPSDLLSTQTQKTAVSATKIAPAVATSKLTWRTRALWAVLAISAIAIFAAAANLLFPDPAFVEGSGNSPVDGMTIFAVFFVGAIAIERLLEPFSSAILPQDVNKQEAADAKKAATESTNAAAAAAIAGTVPDTNKAQTALNAAATAEQAVSDEDWKRKVLFWALASVVAVLASASMHLYFLGTVGISHAARWQEILATGLILGAGTKPLHDLTELVAAKKDAAKS